MRYVIWNIFRLCRMFSPIWRKRIWKSWNCLPLQKVLRSSWKYTMRCWCWSVVMYFRWNWPMPIKNVTTLTGHWPVSWKLILYFRKKRKPMLPWNYFMWSGNMEKGSTVCLICSNRVFWRICFRTSNLLKIKPCCPCYIWMNGWWN